MAEMQNIHCPAKMQLLVAWVTNRCSLRCKGCYMSAGDVEGQDLELETFTATLKNLPFVKGGELQIAGGEPSLVPQIVDDVAHEARRVGIKRISLQTNGVGLDQSFIDILHRHQIGLGLSLDGTPKVNETLRGGTREALQALQLLEDQSFPIGITTVVSCYNVDDLPRLGALLSRYSCVRNIGLDLVRPVGRATEGWLPKPRDLETAYHRLSDVLDWANQRRQHPITLRESQFVEMSNVPQSYCPAMSGQSAVLAPNGTLYPCSSCVGEDAYECGTAFAPNFQILSKGLHAPTPACGQCVVNSCRGRCPSRSLFSEKAGRLDCVLRRAAWDRKQKLLSHNNEVRHVS